jgi:hypothetical protein
MTSKRVAASRLILLLTMAVAVVTATAVVWQAVSSRPPDAQISLFEDVTAGSGISYVGMTHGAAWGDFDGDGLPDLYLTNHLNAPKLFRNLSGGRFEDVTAKWFPSLDAKVDKHGAAWGDVDNDGRLDLVQLAGAERGVGAEPKRLFMNRGDRFEEMAEAMGVANPFGRTRMPLWFDFDRDGRLDLFQGADARFDDRTPPFVFLQRNGRFAESSDVVTFASRTVPFCIVTDLSGRGAPDLVCRVSARGKTTQIFSTGHLPLAELDPLPPTAFEDIAAGDFDNDGAIDLFLARKNPAPSVSLATPSAKEIIADLVIDGGNAGERVGFSFRTPGPLTFRVVPMTPAAALSASQIHLGSGGAHPSGMEFRLTPGDETVNGLAEYRPGAGDGVYVGFTPPDQWQVLLSASREKLAGGKSLQVAVGAASTAPIEALKALGDQQAAEEAPARLFMNRKGKFVEEGEKRRVNLRAVSAVNVVAADFNNDMHLDLFVVASGDIGKQENLLLLNRGDGTFDIVAGAGGAGGDLTGVGDSVTTADFDGDGCLDLLVANGGSMGRSLGLPSERGGYRLYRNLCDTGNRWLAIALKGTKSNRDGIGARVEVTAGGVTQVRIQDGGIHNRGQSHSKLHFGLGKNLRADRIRVRWPSGVIQELTNVPASRFLKIQEP